jgi:hypothetical protein
VKLDGMKTNNSIQKRKAARRPLGYFRHLVQ